MSASEGLVHLTLKELGRVKAQWTTEVEKLEEAMKNRRVLSVHSTLGGQQQSLNFAKKRLAAIKAEIKKRKSK